LLLDLTEAPRRGSDAGHIYRSQPLSVSDGTPIELRVFFDRSVIELYAQGVVMTCRVFPDRPEELTASLSCSERGWTGGSARVWAMRSIWTDTKQR
jgi:sucrose-6-phosphate hydrolase SacC (GH32 family)